MTDGQKGTFRSAFIIGFFLVDLNARSFDYGPPLFNLGLLKFAESFWCLPIAGRNILTNLCKPLPHSRIGQGRNNSGVKFGNDI